MGAGRRQRSASDDAAFRRAVDEAKANHNISDVVRKRAKVVKTGREFVSLCAFHEERTASMRLNDSKGTYHCFGCGASGDIVKLVMHLEGLGFMDALRWLGAADLPAVDPAARIRAAAEDEAERKAAIDRARSVWGKSVSAEGTPAEVYLRSRGITMPIPPSIRFAMTPSWYDDEIGECGPDLPALVGAVTNGADEVIGLQRIFLRDGGRRKAGMDKPKRSLGRIKGGALKLGRAHYAHPHGDGLAPIGSDARTIVVTEGPEDGLSLAQEMPDRQVWVTLGTAMMPFIEYPPEVTTIIIAAQNDEAGRTAVEKASAALLDRGFAVSPVFPPPGFKDWNDQLRGIGC